MHRPDQLRNLVRQGDAEAFARELNLDPVQTRQWFDEGLPEQGYGADVIKALGTHMLTMITGRDPGGHGNG